MLVAVLSIAVYRQRMDKNLRDANLSWDTSWWVKGPPLAILVAIVVAALIWG